MSVYHYANDVASLLYTLRDKKEIVANDENLQFFKYALTQSRTFYGQNFQDMWVSYEMDKRSSWRDFYFVEVGATDGVYMSNTKYFSNLNWGGILVEPNPIWHKELNKNAFKPNIHIDYRCVADKTDQIVDFLITPDPHHATIEAYRNCDYNAGNRQTGEVIPVTTVSLFDLLGDYLAPERISYLSIDTEGSELSILTAFFAENDRYTIDMITVEHNFNEVVRRQIKDLLTDCGYINKFSNFSRWDDFYIKVK